MVAHKIGDNSIGGPEISDFVLLILMEIDNK